MKKLMLFLSFGVWGLLLQACNGQNEKDVPTAVRTSFDTKFPGATDVKWENETENSRLVYEAKFMHQGKKMKATLDEAGALIKAGED